MNIKPGDVISIKHYSGINPLKSVILDINGDILSIKLSREFAALNFLEGDPLVFGFERGDQVFIYGCTINAIDPSEGTLQLKTDKVESASNMRQHERFPVSLYADFRTTDARKKQLATIKDISLYGILAYSKTELKLGDVMDMEIYTDKSVMFIRANVVRKMKATSLFEYGLGIIYDSQSAVNVMSDYIKKLKHEQEEQIRKIRGIG